MKISNISANTNFKAKFSPRMNKYVCDVGNRLIQDNNKEGFREYVGLVSKLKSTLPCGTVDIAGDVATFDHPFLFDNYQLADNITSETCGNFDVLKKIESSLKDIKNSFFKNKNDEDVLNTFVTKKVFKD